MDTDVRVHRKRNMLTDVVDNLTRRNRSDRFPLGLARKRIYILPTAQGLLFIVVLFVMLLGSINYNNNLGFLFTFLLGSMAFVSLLHTHRNLSGLVLQGADIRPVFAGDRAEFVLTLRAGTVNRIGVRLGFKGGEDVSVSLMAGREGQAGIFVPTHRRGQFQVGSLTVSSAYPFGLFRTWSTLYPDLRYLVYPRPLPGPLQFGYDLQDSDNEGALEIKGTDDFKELRAYRPGDAMSRLSWKSFSRGRGLHTKVFSDHAGASLMLRWDDIPQRDQEQKLSRLCDMIQQAHRMNMVYGLSIPGVDIPPGDPKDPRHYHLCLKHLALFGTGGSAGEP